MSRNRINSPKMAHTHITNGFFGRNPQSNSKGKGCLFNRFCHKKTDMHMNENDPQYLLDTIHKNYFEMDHSSQYRK